MLIMLLTILSKAAGVEQAQFPHTLDIHGMALPLEYHFQPGSEADGVTLVCPAAVLNQVTEGRADWLVPGLLRDKVIHLMKGLPKALRRSFVPVPDFADRALGELAPSDTPLTQAASSSEASMLRKAGIIMNTAAGVSTRASCSS